MNSGRSFNARKRFLSALLVAAFGCVFSLPAAAVVTCTVSATPIAFGTYNPLTATATVSTGTVTATCNYVSGGSQNVSIVSSYSAGSSGTFSTRRMLSGANFLTYNLYFDAAYSQIRGDGTGGSQTGGASFTLSSSNRSDSTTSTIYGRAPALQDVAAGTYSDTITVTITY